MRAIRFVTLLIVLAVAFVATPTFELRPFASQLPPDLLTDSELLASFRQWVADDLARMSLILTSWAALTFGLLAVPWPYPTGTSFSYTHYTQSNASTTGSTRHHRSARWWFGLSIILLAIIAIIGMLGMLIRVGEAPFAHLLWVVGLLLLLLGAGLLARPLPPPTPTSAGTTSSPTLSQPRITAAWPLILFTLLLGLILYSWKLTESPANVDEQTAQLGLRALALTTDETPKLFHAQTAVSGIDEAVFDEASVFGVALVSTTLLYWVTQDLLLSTRLIGLLAALSCAVATWFVGIEIFARRTKPVDASVPIEDNGQSPALMAVWLVLFNLAILYFSRRPIVLEATAWGTMGCWALLRGFRTHDRLVLGLSGVLVGFSYLLHGGAIIFVCTTLLWWVGFAAMQLGVLPHLAPTAARKRLHFGDWLIWVLGAIAVLSPVAVARSQELLAWLGQLPPSTESALTTLLANVAPPVDLYPGTLFHVILLPFVPLALGALLFNLDRRQGWVLTTWLGSAFLMAVTIQQQNLRWELLVFMVPVVALTLAFTLDRMRVSLIGVGGRWTQQFVGFLLLGLLLWIGSDNLISYQTFALRQVDRVSAIGYTLRSLPAEQPILVYLPNESMAAFPLTAENAQTNPALQFLTNNRINHPNSSIKFVDSIPDAVATGTVIVLLPEEHATFDDLQARYPAGTVTVQRDIQANPLVHLFSVGSTQQ